MEDASRPVGRRVFLGVIGLGAAGIVVGARVQSAVGRVLRPISSVDGGLSALIPGSDHFRIYTVTGSLPSEPASDYRLAVGGLVERPLNLTLAELEAMPQTSLRRDFQCVTGWRVPSVSWSGVRLAEVLDRAGVRSEAKALTFTSFDGTYTESLTMDQARRSDVIVASRLEGRLLSSEHGGPARLYVAPMYGYKSCKWLSGIKAVADVEPGYWEQQGYDVDGWVGRSNGRNDTPT